jgi:hypothetical protein
MSVTNDAAREFAAWALEAAWAFAAERAHPDRRVRDTATIAAVATRVGFTERGDALFEEVDASIAALAEGAARQRALSDVVWRLVRAGDPDRAMAFTARLDDAGKELGFIGELYVEQGRLDDARRILARGDLPPFAELRVRLALVRRWTEEGGAPGDESFLPRVLELIDAVEKGKPSQKSVAYTAIAALVAQAGDDKHAVSLMRRAAQAARRSRYEGNRGAAIDAWCRELLRMPIPVATKRKLLDVTLPAVRRPGSGVHGNPGLPSVGYAYFALGDLDTGLALVREAKPDDVRILGLTALASLVGPADPPGMLEAIMADAVESIPGLWTMPDHDNRPSMLATVARTWARLGHETSAATAFDQALDRAVAAPKPDQQLAGIVSVLAETPLSPAALAARLEDAERRIGALASSWQAPSHLALVYVRLRRFDRARDLLTRSMEDDASRDLAGRTTAALVDAARLAMERGGGADA